MLNEKGKSILHNISLKLNAIIQKADNDNKKWIQGSELPENLKVVAVSLINDFEKEIARFFAQQKKEYLNAVDNIDFSKKPIRKAEIFGLDELTNMISQYILLNNEHYVDVLSGVYEAFATKAIASSAKIIGGSIKDTKITPETTLTKKAVKWIDKTKIPFAREVQESTNNAIVKTIKNSLLENVGSQNSVNTMYQLFIDGNLDEFRKNLKSTIRNSDNFDWNRARTTARTETLAVTNAGTLEGYRQSGVVKYKKWKCECGGRSRDTHIAADNIVVPVDEPFVVGGYQLMHPGDRSFGAPGREIINCRCAMSGVPEALAGRYTPQDNPYKDKDVGTDEWLHRQSKEFQTGYMGGEEKQRLFSEGSISADDKDKTVSELKSSFYIVDKGKLNTKEYTDKFSGVGKNHIIDTKVRNVSIDILNHRTGTPFEDAYYISERTGKTLFANNKDDMKFGVRKTKESVKFLSDDSETVIAIHNHPGSSRPSIADLKTMLQYPKIKKMVVVGHDRTVYIISDMNKDMTRNALDELYNRWYNYYKLTYPKDIAETKTMDLIYSLDIFKMIER